MFDVQKIKVSSIHAMTAQGIAPGGLGVYMQSTTGWFQTLFFTMKSMKHMK
jgi:hypothetical protein